ncbi:hypothetical protein [Abyssogena phaseoliformis symbiont]|uniref:hypothetical protein n=1 Tax=Abyssogena phaseoliformis symbiont TaxID=596095 RepID=UPI00191541FE|nr:hypothetical protein [Abyssogena phaseoliformis symbiont]
MFETTAKTFSGDALDNFYTTFESTAKVLSENIGDTVVKLDMSAITPDVGGGSKEVKASSEDAIAKLVLFLALKVMRCHQVKRTKLVTN